MALARIAVYGNCEISSVCFPRRLCGCDVDIGPRCSLACLGRESVDLCTPCRVYVCVQACKILHPAKDVSFADGSEDDGGLTANTMR
jgi:hypothetical protein